MKQRNRFGIEFILSNDDEKSSFESYCRYKGIYIPPSFIESLLKDNQQRIKEIGDELQALEAGFDSKLCQIQESSTALHTLQKETK